MMLRPSDDLKDLQREAGAFGARLLRIVIGVLFVVMLIDVALGLAPVLKGLVAFAQRALS